MTSPTLSNVTYPPTFASSFWTYPEYRKGAVVLYSRLQEGLDENESLLALVRHRAEAEVAYADALAHPPTAPCVDTILFPAAVEPSRPGYRAYNTLSSQAIRQLPQAMGQEGEHHTRIAQQLQSLILTPFGKWAYAHADRVHASWHKIDAALLAMERQTAETAKRRTVYETRCQQADEAEDDVRFAPAPNVQSPSSRDAAKTVSESTPSQPEQPRVASMPLPSMVVSDSPESVRQSTSSVSTDEAQKLKRRETLRQQFGFKPRPEGEPAARAKEESESNHRRQESRLSSYWSLTMGKVSDSQTLAQVKAAVTGLAEPRHLRLRREAEVAEEAYRESVKLLDSLRTTAEQVLFHEYRFAQKWEMDRVTAVQRVLSAFRHAVGSGVDEQVRDFTPRAHLEQLIAAHRTGPFRPVSTVFKPYYYDDSKTVAGVSAAGFGMDLLSAAKGAALAAQASHPGSTSSAATSAMPTLPPVLHELLAALQRCYAERTRWLPPSGKATEDDIRGEKRRIWLYEVPLGTVHQLRRQLIDHYDARASSAAADVPAPDHLLDAVDAPVLAATVKLWLLELESPLVPFTLWDEVAEIYEAARVRTQAVDDGSAERVKKELVEPTLHGLALVLQRLPKLHLACLDVFVAHLYKLMKDTPTDESNEMYATKLGVSLGRYILRPSGSLPSMLYAEYPALLLKDLILHYEELLPPLVRAKAKESDMKVLNSFKTGLLRQRSMLVDERIKRSSLGGLGLPAEALQRRVTQIGTRYASTPAGRASGTVRPLSMASLSQTTPTKQKDTAPTSLVQDVSPVREAAASSRSVDTDKASDPKALPSATTQAAETPAPKLDLAVAPSATGVGRPSPGMAHAKRHSISERRKLFEAASEQADSVAPADGDPAPPIESLNRASPSLQRRPRTGPVRGPRGPRQVSR